MATTNTLLTLVPQGAHAEAAGKPVGPPINSLTRVGLAGGIGFPAKVASGAVWLARLPATAGLSTGATFALMVAEDVRNADPGKVARFAVTVKKLATGTDVIDADGGGTETAADLILPSTSGVVLTGSIAIVVANMDSAAAGDWVLIRVRRLGTHANDTHKGTVVLLGVDVRDT